MKRYCHTCGHQADDGEVFCEKCGSKIMTEESQIPKDNFSQGHQTINNNAAKNTSAGLKFAKIMGIISGIGMLIIVILVGIATLLPDDPVKPPNNPTTTTSTSTNPTKPAADKALATWSANLKSTAAYSDADKKVNIDYTVVLKNEGTGSASNIKVYLVPQQNDPNAQFLGITEITVVNIDENITQIKAGETRNINTKFFYNDVPASSITQAYLQDIANKFVLIPVVVEWQENGKTYTQNLIRN